MLASDTCAPCLVARNWLAQHAVPFSECSIERDAQCRALFDAAGARGTPLILVRGQMQLGFSAERVLLGLQATAKGG
jgi:arsenate reductase-like glutaredoxin family protein